MILPMHVPAEVPKWIEELNLGADAEHFAFMMKDEAPSH